MIEIPGFVIYGPPRTKKNHGKIIHIRQKGARPCASCGHVKGFPKMMPSDQFTEWQDDALRQMLLIRARLAQRGVNLPIAGLVSIEARIYRETAIGDVNGYQQAIGDMLQAARVIVDDAQIEDWDGTRRLKDRERPRVEIYITVIEPRAVQEGLSLEAAGEFPPRNA